MVIALARHKMKFITAFLGIIILTCGGMVARYAWLKGQSDMASISPRGGTPLPRFALDQTPIVLQTDPRWKDSRLGGSGERFGATGCAICCMSMAMNHYNIGMRPDSLNAILQAASGFTRQGWIKWDAITDITDGRISVETDLPLTHATIDSVLRQGIPLLARVMIRGTFNHWVLVVGKEGTEYLIKDPLGDGTRLDSLSRYNSNIYAIRIVRKI
ncbi:MAG: hypothetical protein JWQ98_3411 [Chlorobi bacterium]|nr:hypothetical protein [Chlorobiota bacterium]